MNQPSRRLLIRPGAIGDFIVSLPAMEALRADYTEVWCAEGNVPLARFADSARSIGNSGLDRLGLLPADDVVSRLWSFDSIISWYGTRNEVFRETARKLALPIQFLDALPLGGCHAVEYYRQQALSLGAREVGRVPSIRCPDKAREYAVIHPFASNVNKRAPMLQFEVLAERLSKNMPVHWLSGPEEELPGAVQFPNLYDLACWLRGARIFVGNDSGIGHLAAGVGTPVLSMFRTTDPRIWAPRGVAVDVVRVTA